VAAESIDQLYYAVTRITIHYCTYTMEMDPYELILVPSPRFLNQRHVPPEEEPTELKKGGVEFGTVSIQAKALAVSLRALAMMSSS
jgi:hypothetical protein